jgi:hypothetical protein
MTESASRNRGCHASEKGTRGDEKHTKLITIDGRRTQNFSSFSLSNDNSTALGEK